MGQISALAIAVGFFLPWVSVSCNGAPQSAVSFTGLELAGGPVINGTHLPGTPSLFLLIVAALVVLAIPFVVTPSKVAATCTLITGAVGLMPVLSTWQDFERTRSQLVLVELQVGLWLSLLGLAGVFAAGLLGLREPDPRGARRPGPGPQYPSP